MIYSLGYRRSAARHYVLEMLQASGYDWNDIDVDGMVGEIANAVDGIDYDTITMEQFVALTRKYEHPVSASDEEILAALDRSRTGWTVMVRLGDITDVIELRNPELHTDAQVRAHLAGLFAFNVEFKIFPMIG